MNRLLFHSHLHSVIPFKIVFWIEVMVSWYSIGTACIIEALHSALREQHLCSFPSLVSLFILMGESTGYMQEGEGRSKPP